MTVVARIEGPIGPGELIEKLERILQDNEVSLIAARAEREERDFTQTLRREQDAAFLKSSKADQEKERKRREEQDKIDQEKQRLVDEENKRKEMIQERERMKEELKIEIPEEPAVDDPDVDEAVSKETIDSLQESIKGSDTKNIVSHLDSPQNDAASTEVTDVVKGGKDIPKEEQNSSVTEEVGYNSPLSAAIDNEIRAEGSARDSFTTRHECHETSCGECGTGDEMGAVGGARQKEIPTKGILAVKIKTKRKKILSAIPEIRPDNISLPPKKKNIIFNFSEETEDQSNEIPPKNHIDFDPVTTVRYYDSKEGDDTSKEPESFSPGEEFLQDIEGRLKKDIKFTPKRGDQHRSDLRHQQTVSSIAETKEWYLSSDDPRYGVHQSYLDPPPTATEGIEDDKQATQQEEQRENGGIKPVGQTMEDVLINYSDNMEEEANKPKHIGRLKRIRRFCKRFFCCTAGLTTYTYSNVNTLIYLSFTCYHMFLP
uniref:FAS-associated factor 2-B n=1 Tax=Magallana gigas TaxID=29159 RepID=K1R019_MAGGI